MSVRQYIGARYVPIFMGQWDNTVAYEPLSIVTYMQSSYTSRKYCPAGTLPTNNEYWALTGNYNAQVEAYRQQVEDYQSEVEEYDARIATAETAAANANTTAQNVRKFPAKFFEGTVAVGFGDSNMEDNVSTGYGNIFYLLCDKLGIANRENYGESSACFQRNTQAGNPVIVDQVRNATTTNPQNVGLVVLIGGTNDYHHLTYDENAFTNTVRATLREIKSKYPNALVISIFDSSYRLPNNRLIRYQQIFRNVSCEYMSGDTDLSLTSKVMNISLADFCLDRSNFMTSTPTHYSPSGAKNAVSRIIAGIFGGEGYKPLPYVTSTSPESGFSNASCRTVTTVDPINLVRRDHHRVQLNSNFTSSVDPITQGDNILIVPGSVYGNGYIGMSLISNTNTELIGWAYTNIDQTEVLSEPKIAYHFAYDTAFSSVQGHYGIYEDVTFIDGAGPH